MTRRHCETRRASDGTLVRVQGALAQEDLDRLAAAVKTYEDTRCHALSDVPMPEIAQRIHGRETYWCGREQGHEPPHRWPAEGHDGRASRPPIEWVDDEPRRLCDPLPPGEEEPPLDRRLCDPEET